MHTFTQIALWPKTIHDHKNYLNNNKVAITAGNEATSTTLVTNEVGKAVRYFVAWIPLFKDMSMQYSKYKTVIDDWNSCAFEQNLNPTERYAIHFFSAAYNT